MPPHFKEPLSAFRLKPLRAARVSEISEATASSAVAPEERVNFHIGNPVQDERLASAYLRMAVGLDIRREDLSAENKEAILKTLGWDDKDTPKLEFLHRLIQKSAPYTPRGGFARANPDPLVKTFLEWLQNQPEPLAYDLGQSSGKREIVLATGGLEESLRVLFHALSNSLAELPATILLHQAPFRIDESAFSGLTFQRLRDDEHQMLEDVRGHIAQMPERPTFLVMGIVLGEETRRALRQISLSEPLFFIETNDAPNHLSLAREAKLVQRVVRFLTPGIFARHLRTLATIFVAGNADILNVFESVHFQLKGTPSASEIELLSYLLEHGLGPSTPDEVVPEVSVEPPFLGISLARHSSETLPSLAQGIERRLGAVVNSVAGALDRRLQTIAEKTDRIASRSESFAPLAPFDRFARLDTKEFLKELASRVDSPVWQEELEQGLLSVFLGHHPEYRLARCVAVSGSSRTALGLLGFHCGIREVLIPDLSWSYEHCFPRVEAVALTRELGLDIEALMEAVQAKLNADPRWSEFGAVALNNPHNATGRVFDEKGVRRLLSWLLEHGIVVIDDLAYQDVAPSTELPRFKTIRQLADEMVVRGELSEAQAAKVITVHSVSKTDCLAGARLAVVEIREEALYRRFVAAYSHLKPNLGALALTYLFYRNEAEVARSYWRLRNKIFLERTQALAEAVSNLPRDRNPFNISILPPTGSMYPLLAIDRLPSGLSLDWLASGLARQGIGMLPLSTFARTEDGFETGRKTFRLTLGGTDGAEVLLNKTRRVLIDLNRLITEESSRYNRIKFAGNLLSKRGTEEERRNQQRWQRIEEAVVREARRTSPRMLGEFRDSELLRRFSEEYVPERLSLLRQRWEDRSLLTAELVRQAQEDGGKSLTERLEPEFYKDSLPRRELEYRCRTYDRTVHPTQMYSIKTEALFEGIIGRLLREEEITSFVFEEAAQVLLEEFLGLNVAIASSDESDELVLDLDAIIAAENYAALSGADGRRSLISFWGDWDGSNRPSGQGHRLVATTLMANIRRLSKILTVLLTVDDGIKVDQALLNEVRALPENNRRFTRLLNKITTLTHQLEKRYRGVLPFSVRPSAVRSMGMKLHVARDPVTLLWHHNDRLERRMLDLRQQRREMLEYYFSFNKQLRKQLHALLPAIRQNIDSRELLREAAPYRDLLQRMVISPRIHQNLITAQDSFAIETTVHNVYEVNEIAARYGNPGMILSMQVSMSTKAEALLSLDRKLRARSDQALRSSSDLDLPTIRLIPLFEDLAAVRSIPEYLGKIWDYAHQSRRLNQEIGDRFAEIISEVFIAGSDLSQQVGQAAGAAMYRQAKHDLMRWLAERRLVDRVRIKMGSGEPMQRQGGYYSSVSGEPAFRQSAESRRLIASQLPAAARKSTAYATTPLMGVFTGGDLRTLQSTISEQLRYLPVEEMSHVLHHLRESQRRHSDDLIRAGESLVESRLQHKKRGEQEIVRLTVGTQDAVTDQFLSLLTDDFRQILYGREEDVVGVHVISYFIARTMPQLRDRPTVRPTAGSHSERGQKILEQIAQTIPMARHGSRLRAIAHNQAQTAVLGFNQLTTGLFRALDRFTQLEFKEGDGQLLIAERILPHLPVYEILHTLRIYHDPALTFVKQIEPAFPAGNSALLALREDNDSLQKYIGLIQQELLRRHGLEVNDFFKNGSFAAELLPTLRPDLAVLLQENLFNTSLERIVDPASSKADAEWRLSVGKLLAMPVEVRAWRSKIWELLGEPIFLRVQSFAELGVALHSLSANEPLKRAPSAFRELKVSSDLSHFFRAANTNDDMHQFLGAALNYLTSISEGMVEVPVAIIRSLKEVEQIARIEEQALSPEKQELLRFYMLQIARLAGENG